MQELSAILAHAERDQDRLAAVLRLVIAATLFIAVFAVREHGAHHHPLLVTTVTYGMVAASSAWLAWRGYHHRLLPYAFATCEAMLLAVQLVLLSSLLHLPSNLILALPVSGFVFVLLVHASIRYRPWLVVHTAATIGVSMFVAMRVFEVVPSEPHKLMEIDQTSLLHDLVHYQAFPFITLGLVTLMLVVANTRMRSLLNNHVVNIVRVAKLRRYFSRSIADELATRTDEELFRGRRVQAAVMFADVRGFSRLAEAMEPDQLGNFLCELRTKLAYIVGRHGGTIDKFIGDSVMAVFGIPDRHEDDAAHAIACALDMIEAIGTWSQDRTERGDVPVDVGIGVHHGEVFAGVLGGDDLLEFTVIGDTVNVAERLERLSRDLDTPIVVSADCLNAAGRATDRRQWQMLPSQCLPGREQMLDVYHLRGDGPDWSARPKRRSVDEPRELVKV